MAVVKRLKRTEEAGDAVDRISSLPDNIIHKILSFLPMKEAIRTSLLSKNWKMHWTVVPKLEFNASPSKLSNADFHILVKFITKVLRNKDAVLESFSINLGNERACPSIETWTTCALTRRVKKINITGISRMPKCLYGSKTLVVLQLAFVTLYVPPSVHLPRLKTLHLKAVNYTNSESLGRLIAGCSVLEDLMVERRPESKFSFTISAPLLESLKFYVFGFDGSGEDFVNEIQLDAPSLKYLTVWDSAAAVRFIKNLDEVRRVGICTPNCCLVSDYLKACRKAKYLILITSQIYYKPCTNLACVKDLKGTFNSLIHLYIRVVPHHRIMLLKLLGLCPKLRVLDLEFDKVPQDPMFGTLFDALLREELRDNPQPWCLNLKRFCLTAFTGDRYEVTLVAYIGKVAPKLEIIDIEEGFYSIEDLASVKKHLHAIPRLSPASQIKFTSC